VFGVQTHRTAARIQTRQNADHPLAGYTYTNRQTLERARCGPQNDLKERTAAAKIAGWTTAVEKVRSKQAGLAEQAAVASRVKLAEPVQASEARSAVCTEN